MGRERGDRDGDAFLDEVARDGGAALGHFAGQAHGDGRTVSERFVDAGFEVFQVFDLVVVKGAVALAVGDDGGHDGVESLAEFGCYAGVAD